MTPRLISTIDHSMMGCESVYVERADIVWMRMHWMMVTKNPRAKSKVRATWQSWSVLSSLIDITHACVTDLATLVELQAPKDWEGHDYDEYIPCQTGTSKCEVHRQCVDAFAFYAGVPLCIDR